MIAQNDWVKGNKNAQVVIIEYSDFECPACAVYAPVAKKLFEEKELKNRFALVYRHFPLQQHLAAVPAAYAAEAAGKQGKFWEMHDMLFEKQEEWSKASDVKKTFLAYARALKLNEEQFVKDSESSPTRERVQNDLNIGNRLQINATPTFFVNGEQIQNPSSYEEFKKIISAALAKAPPITQKEENVHIHADFKMYINGSVFDLTQDKYQTSEEKEASSSVHIHDKNGDIVHAHKKGVTIGDFFRSIGMSFAKDCLTLDNGKNYCNQTGMKLKFFVNGKENITFETYEIKDLDRILVSYGPVTDPTVQKQIDSVGDRACIYSEKCPERGKPPDEECIGELGGKC